MAKNIIHLVQTIKEPGLIRRISTYASSKNVSNSILSSALPSGFSLISVTPNVVSAEKYQQKNNFIIFHM